MARILRPLSLGCLAVTILLYGAYSASATPISSPAAIARVFNQISDSPALANPSILLMDRNTGEVVFERDAQSLRKPASILKILSTAVALEYLSPTYQFTTTASLATTPRTIVIAGTFDPWMTASSAVAARYKRAWIPYLASASIRELNATGSSPVKNIAIKYSGLYPRDVSALRNYFKIKGISAKFSQEEPSISSQTIGAHITTISSPPVSEMVKFAMLWSDNLLAERLARSGAHATGFAMTDVGVSEATKKLLATLGIDPSGLDIRDGSGLSKQDRVTATLMAHVLLKVRTDQKFAAIYEGMPVSGVSGTLIDRYLATAPEAIGLVRAKTGTLNGTVSLAGYVEAGVKEYIFVGIADQIRHGSTATNQARNTLDRLLGKITSPLLIAK